MVLNTVVYEITEEIQSGRRSLFDTIKGYLTIIENLENTEQDKYDYLESACASCDAAEGMNDLKCDIEWLKQENKNLKDTLSKGIKE